MELSVSKTGSNVLSLSTFLFFFLLPRAVATSFLLSITDDVSRGNDSGTTKKKSSWEILNCELTIMQ